MCSINFQTRFSRERSLRRKNVHSFVTTRRITFEFSIRMRPRRHRTPCRWLYASTRRVAVVALPHKEARQPRERMFHTLPRSSEINYRIVKLRSSALFVFHYSFFESLAKQGVPFRGLTRDYLAAIDANYARLSFSRRWLDFSTNQ